MCQMLCTGSIDLGKKHKTGDNQNNLQLQMYSQLSLSGHHCKANRHLPKADMDGWSRQNFTCLSVTELSLRRTPLQGGQRTLISKIQVKKLIHVHVPGH